MSIKRLKRQCENMEIPVITDLSTALRGAHVILDAIFGFSFSGPVRPPFDTALNELNKSQLPILSVDIPSGWDVETGKPNDNTQNLDSETLISLTAPKAGVKEFRGRHFLGGRFVPPSLQQKFALNLPAYEGSNQIVELQSSLSDISEHQL